MILAYGDIGNRSVFSIHDLTEIAIHKMIDANQRMLKVNNKETLGGLGPPQKRHFELEIKTPQNAPKDASLFGESFTSLIP